MLNFLEILITVNSCKSAPFNQTPLPLDTDCQGTELPKTN